MGEEVQLEPQMVDQLEAVQPLPPPADPPSDVEHGGYVQAESVEECNAAVEPPAVDAPHEEVKPAEEPTAVAEVKEEKPPAPAESAEEFKAAVEPPVAEALN